MDLDSATTLMSWGPIILMVVFFYFLLYRPQKNAQRRRQEMLATLKIGDEIITVAGLYGFIERLDTNTVMLRVAEGVSLRFSRSAVSSVVDEKEDDNQ